MKLTHISKRLETIIVRAAGEQTATFKPEGFWYSVDGEWECWCKSEQPDWLEGARVYQVTLGDESIIRLQSVEEIDEFHEKYRAGEGDYWKKNFIDWSRVAKDYDGIEIAPYQWERRLSGKAHMWYYSWDCASGCIWRPKGIYVKETPKTAAPKTKGD